MGAKMPVPAPNRDPITRAIDASHRKPDASPAPPGAFACCPACGSADLAVTCMGIFGGRDANHARCGCGWKGRAYQLVPKKADA